MSKKKDFLEIMSRSRRIDQLPEDVNLSPDDYFIVHSQKEGKAMKVKSSNVTFSESEKQAIYDKINSLQDTTARYAFDTLQEAQDKWASFSQEEKDELDGKTFFVKDENAEYKWDSTQTGGTDFVREFTDVPKGEISAGSIKLDLIGGRVYGDVAPVSGSLEIDNTGAVIGGTALVYHQASTAPIFDIGKVLLMGEYVSNELNLITICKIGANSIGVVFSRPSVDDNNIYIDWVQEEGGAVDDGNGTLSVAGGSWDRGAISSKAIRGDNAVSFSTSQNTNPAWNINQGVGLASSYAGITEDKFNMDIFLIVDTGSGEVSVFEDGSSVFLMNVTPASSDVYTLKKQGASVSVLRNDQLIYTSGKVFSGDYAVVGLGFGLSSITGRIIGAYFENENLVLR